MSERNPVAIPVASTYLSQAHLSQVHATQVLMQAINLNPNHRCWRTGGLIVGRVGGRWMGWTGAWDKAQFRGYLGEALMNPRRRGCALDALDAELSLICTFCGAFLFQSTDRTPKITDYTPQNKLYPQAGFSQEKKATEYKDMRENQLMRHVFRLFFSPT